MPKFTRADVRRILGDAHTEEIENQLMSLHLGVVDSLKDDLAKVKAEAERLPKVEEELNKLKGEGNDSYKEKYEKEHQAFEDYKAEQTAKENKATKTAAFRELLKKAGVSEKRLDAVLKVSSSAIDEIELDKDGNIKDADTVSKSIKSEWADFIVKEGSMGAKTASPPDRTSGPVKTKEEIMAIKDTTERQAAWGEYLKAQQT